MIAWNVVVAIIAALFILEGMFILMMPKQTIKFARKLIKDKKKLASIGLIEAIVGIIVLLAVLFYS